ncbi:MAG: 16S rRNA (cytidine(1402)-2'-O)-methyltransferase [Acidobacteriota bacterium]
MTGTLYVVSTPIGNLEDITLRALRVLREVDLIACEDTRHTARLLRHYGIETPRLSYHEHNEAERSAQLIGEIVAGKNIALVSDAGTPCVSDPGYRLVKAARERNLPVVPIPGPSSILAALMASGQPSDSFVFLGFLPSRKQARRSLLQQLAAVQRTHVFFESPVRLVDCLTDLKEVLGNRRITVAREMTKMHEEFFWGSVEEGLSHFKSRVVKGEIVVLVEKATEAPTRQEDLNIPELRLRLNQLIQEEGLSRSEATKRLARQLNLPKRELYQRLLQSS